MPLSILSLFRSLALLLSCSLSFSLSLTFLGSQQHVAIALEICKPLSTSYKEIWKRILITRDMSSTLKHLSAIDQQHVSATDKQHARRLVSFSAFFSSESSSSLAFYWHSKKVSDPPLCPSRFTKRLTYHPAV